MKNTTAPDYPTWLVSTLNTLARRFLSPFSFVLALALTVFYAYPLFYDTDVQPKYFLDINIYYEALKHWKETGDLYNWALPPTERYGFTYPPFPALAFQPLLLFPNGTALTYGVFVCNLILGFLAVFISLKGMIKSKRLIAAIAVWSLPFSFAIFPVKANLGMGQTNMMLLVLIICDLLLLSNTKFSGILSSIAASIKMTPAVFIIYFLAKKDWPAAIRFVATGIAGILLSLIIIPRVTLDFFTDKIFESSRVGGPEQTSSFAINSIYTRLVGTDAAKPLYLITALALVVATYFVARYWLNRNEKLAAATSVGFTMLLVSPISWNHHWVWVVPAFICAVRFAFIYSSGYGIFLALSLIAIVTMRVDWWFGIVWPAGEWPLHAILMHGILELWAIAFLAMPLVVGKPKAPALKEPGLA